MKKTIVIVTGIIVAGLLIGYYIYTQNKALTLLRQAIKPEKSLSENIVGYVENKQIQKINGILNSKKGDFKVIGWKTERIEENNYLASFTYKENGQTYGWFYEVKPVGNIVRDVSLDRELMKKYNVAPKVMFTEEEEAELRDLLNKNMEYAKGSRSTLSETYSF